MEKSKLTEALRRLPSKSLPRFVDFVRSPYFNKNEKLVKLVEAMLPYAPEFRHPKLAKRNIYQEIFGHDENYNELKLNNLSSQLLKAYYHYLSETSFQNDENQKLKLQLERLTDLDLDHHADLLIKRHERRNETRTNLPLNDILQNYFLQENQHNLHTRRQPRKISPCLQFANDQLDLWFVLQKLRMACQMENGNMLIQADYACHFIDEILRFLEKDFRHLTKEPLVKVYTSTLKMLRSHALSASEQDSSFLSCKNELQKHADRLENSELYTLSHYLLNFCIKKINTGESRYYQEIFDLYQLLLQGETILRNGQISQWTFRNVITSGIRLQEFKWTEDFIERYRIHLPEEEQSTAVAYNLAILNLARNDFDMALRSLLNVEFSDPFYYVSARIIQSQCYFELGEEQAFSALVASTQKYLRRSKLSEYHKRSNGNFLKIVKKMFQLKNNRTYLKANDFKRKLDVLKIGLDTLEPVVNKSWLKSKLGEF